MCDLISDVISCCVWVKSTHLIKSMFEKQKKGENMEIKDIIT